MSLGLLVALDDHIAHLRFQDPHVDGAVLDTHILDLDEGVAGLFVLLAYPLKVVPEESPVEDRSRTGEDDLHQLIGREDRVAGEVDIADYGVLLDLVLHEDTTELLDHTDVDEGKEAETVNCVDVLLDLFGVELVPGLGTDDTEDVIGNDLLVSGDVDTDDDRLNGRIGRTGHHKDEHKGKSRGPYPFHVNSTPFTVSDISYPGIINYYSGLWSTIPSPLRALWPISMRERISSRAAAGALFSSIATGDASLVGWGFRMGVNGVTSAGKSW